MKSLKAPILLLALISFASAFAQTQDELSTPINNSTINSIIGVDRDLKFILLVEQNNAYFLSLKSADMLEIRDNTIYLTRPDNQFSSFKFDISNTQLNIYLTPERQQELEIKTYKILSEDIESIVFDLFIDTPEKLNTVMANQDRFPYQFHFLLSSYYAFEIPYVENINNLFIRTMLADSNYELAKEVYKKLYSPKDANTYFDKELDSSFDNLLIHAIEAEDIALLSSIPDSYFEDHIQLNTNISISYLGYAVLQHKKKAMLFLSKKSAQPEYIIIDTSRNKKYTYQNLPELVRDEDALLDYYEILYKKRNY
ncbi:hypothetical protein [Sphingobacterium bovistauri]|uniref:DUF4369 domain-containing protein n=1 Tax=Sphingobacterium bovistauri TaxID=2781959 RepID=A0ABS7Z4U0_9SPHI|nr:hypothetical protein [Sphingobacterium bovistauri]MCA5005211.1 hypothetical protein [Sphingobacterium bovistauri]